MTVGEVLISGEIKDHLGDSGVTEVTGWLWAVDCQTCGRPLGSDPPALCVDDMVHSPRHPCTTRNAGLRNGAKGHSSAPGTLTRSRTRPGLSCSR